MQVKKKTTAVALGLSVALAMGGVAFAGGKSVPQTPILPNNTVELHKLAYQNNATEVQNTGDEMQLSSFGADARAWNNKTDGAVKFTAYKLDDSQLNINETPQAVAQKVANAIANKQELPYGAKQTGEPVSVDDNGLATFKLYDGTYVFVESTVSGVVTQSAKPMLVRLPMANADGRSNKDKVALYPKNKIKEAEVSFTKYLQESGKDPAVYKNADSGFSLYKGEPGKGTKVKDSYQNLANGTITVKGLSVGKYYFVEENHIWSDRIDYKKGPNGIGYDTDVTNNAKNLLTFEYTDEGKIVFPDDSLLKAGNKVINYTMPSENSADGGIIKTADKKSVGFNEDITYTVQTKVPANIKKYKSYSLTDNPGNLLKIDASTFRLEAVKTADNTKIKDITFTQTNDKNSYTITPTLSELQALPNGTSLKLTYKAQLNSEYVTNIKPGQKDVINKVTLNYNNHVVSSSTEGSESIKSYEAVLKKVDNGIFNSGIVKQPLKGAKFILGKDFGGTEKYLKTNKVAKVSEYTHGGKIMTKDDIQYEWVTDKTQATEFDTGDDGMLTVIGLGNGNYKFIETQAPTGYNLNSKVESKFTINDANIDGDKTIEVTNSRKPDMPLTGTEVTVLMVAGLAGAAGIITIVKKRKKRN